jgi:hypothetical protein
LNQKIKDSTIASSSPNHSLHAPALSLLPLPVRCFDPAASPTPGLSAAARAVANKVLITMKRFLYRIEQTIMLV